MSHCTEKGVQRLHAWLWCVTLPVLFFLLFEKSDQAPHLRESLATGALDRNQRVAFALLSGREQTSHRAGLNRHHRNRMGNDVVQLPSDPPALFDDGAA